MLDFLNKTQTFILSCISSIASIINRKKSENQVGIFAFLSVLVFLILISSCSIAYADDPLSVPNNRFGIHIISPTQEEASNAATLVNSSGGAWGYVTVPIGAGDWKKDKWQQFFDVLRRYHLIPILRLTTNIDRSSWRVPDPEEAAGWADFLNSLNWPVKNRYVIIYNEPNQSGEWGGKVDASSYAHVLDSTITALKNKSSDFFVLNGGFDASAPQNKPDFEDEVSFLTEMNQEVPGIFNRLDGWVSHSYPNPGFVGSVDALGRGTIRSYQWELGVLASLGLNKKLPVFITETGWKHAEGIYYDKSLPTSQRVGDYIKQAFLGAWSDPDIAAVTPFILNYQQAPFDHFSFETPQEGEGNQAVLGSVYPFYPQYVAMVNLSKAAGTPEQIDSATLKDGGIFKSIVSGEVYPVPFTFQNSGQAIWGDSGVVSLKTIQGGTDLGLGEDSIPAGKKVEPGGTYTFHLMLKAPVGGNFKVVLELDNGGKKIQTQPLEFETAVSPPVILQIKSQLRWKHDSSGQYLLTIIADITSGVKNIVLGASGISDQVETRDLIPDSYVDFTLKKPFYQPKTIIQQVHSGVNTLDFGTLQPDFQSAILNPKELWQLLPFSN